MEKTKQPISLFQSLVAILTSSIVFCAGFALGQKTVSENNPSVLGVQSPKKLSSLMASLIQINREPNLQLSPENFNHPVIVPVATETPVPEPTETNSPAFGGLFRNPSPTMSSPKPTSTLVPTSVPTPVENIIDNNNKAKITPTPTSPGYRYGGTGRNGPTVTPTLVPKPIEDSMGKNDRNKVTPTPTPSTLYIPDQLGKIVDIVGANLKNPQISRNTEDNGYKISGTLRDKFFGIFSIPYPVEIIVNDSSGEIENVSIPWWRTLFGNPFTGTIFKPVCGDGVCSSSVESFDNCKEDCTPVCGNGICEYGEGVDTCEADCSTGR